jgi:serine/threonine protein kinase
VFTKFARKRLSSIEEYEGAMITMANVGVPLHSAFNTWVDTLGADSAVVNAVGVLACLLRALVFLHRHSIFHCDIGPGNIMVDAGNVGRFIDLGNVELLSRIVLNGRFQEIFEEDGMPFYDNAFDGLLLSQVQGTLEPGKNTTEFLQIKLPAAFDVAGALAAHTSWGKRQALPTQTQTLLSVTPLPDSDQVRDVFVENAAYWGAAAKAKNFGAFDIYALAITFADSLKTHLNPSSARVSAETLAIIDQLRSTVLLPMTVPVASERPTASQAFATVKDLCGKFGILIPAPIPLAGTPS